MLGSCTLAHFDEPAVNFFQSLLSVYHLHIMFSFSAYTQENIQSAIESQALCSVELYHVSGYCETDTLFLAVLGCTDKNTGYDELGPVIEHRYLQLLFYYGHCEHV